MRTELGVAFRSVGANAEMTEAQGISVPAMRLLGMGIAAALSVLAGAIVVQSQGYADVNIGFGVVINALAAVIIGELLLARAPVHRQLLAPILGSIVYAQVVSMCLAIGLASTDLKLASGLLVLAMLALPRLMGREQAAERESGFSGP